MPQAAILLAIVTVPALFIPFAQNPFEPHKAAFLWVAASAAIAAGALHARRVISSANKLQRAAVVVVALTTAAMIVSTVMSDAPHLAWWGSTLRAYGTLTEIALFAIMMAAVAVCDGAFAGRMQTAIVIASVPPTIYALAQIAGVDPLMWDVGVLSRPAGTFGNPLFFGGYLVTVLPLTVAAAAAESLAVRRERRARTRETVLWILSALQIVALAATRSRGPVVAAVAGLGGAVLVVAAVYGRGYLRWMPAALALAAGLVVVAIVPARLNAPARRTLPLALGSAAAGDTAEVRLLLWRAMVRGVPTDFTHAALGSGPEETTRVLSRYAGPELPELEGPNTAPDRAHNSTLERLVAFGIVGVVLQFVLSGVVVAAVLLGAGLLRREDVFRFIVFAILMSLAVTGVLVATGGAWAIAFALPAAILTTAAGWILWRSRAAFVVDAPTHDMLLAVAAAFGVWLGHVVDTSLSVETLAASLNAVVVAAILFTADARITGHRTRESTREAGLLAGWMAALVTIALAGPGRDPGVMAWLVGGLTLVTAGGIAAVDRRGIGWAAIAWLAVSSIVLFWHDDPIPVLYVLAGLSVAAAAGARAWRSTAFAAATIAGVTAGIYAVGKTSADVALRSAAARPASDPQSAIALYRDVVAKDPLEAEAFTQMAETTMNVAGGSNGAARDALFTEAGRALLQSRAADPFDYHHLRNLASWNRRWTAGLSPVERPAHQAEADRWYRQAVELAPDRGTLWTEWANLDAERGNLGGAFSKLERGATLGDIADAVAVADAIFRFERRDLDHPAGLRQLANELRSRGQTSLASAYDRRAITP